MHKRQKGADMANEVLARQAKTRAEQTGEAFEDALEAVMGTEAGRQLKELRNGSHHGVRAQDWQERLARERAEERADAVGWSPSNKSLAPRWTSHGGVRDKRLPGNRARPRSVDRPVGGAGVHLRSQYGVRRRHPPGGQQQGHRPVG
jgi:hypothetical protein